MPQRTNQTQKTLTKHLLTQSKHYQKIKSYKQALSQYKQLLSIVPNTSNTLNTLNTIKIRYLYCLTQVQSYIVAKPIFQSFVHYHTHNQDVFMQFVKFLQKWEQYEVLKGRILGKIGDCDMGYVGNQGNQGRDRAQYGHYSKNAYITLYIQYAKVCHRSKCFEDGTKMLKILESKQEEVRKEESVMVWRIYLEYQAGNYAQAYKYSQRLLKQAKLSKQDIQYYQYQKSKLSLLLSKYNQSITQSNQLLEHSIQTRNKLKAITLKSYSYFQLNQLPNCLSLLQQTHQQYPQDIFLLLKYTLILLQCLPVQNSSSSLPCLTFKQLMLYRVEENLNYVLKEFYACRKDNFDDLQFSEHFNWYQEVEEYRRHFQWLLRLVVGKLGGKEGKEGKEDGKMEGMSNKENNSKVLADTHKTTNKPQKQGYFQDLQPESYILNSTMNTNLKLKLKQISKHLFLILIQGYNDCKKTINKLITIQQEIEKFIFDFNFNQQQQKEDKEQKQKQKQMEKQQEQEKQKQKMEEISKQIYK